MASEPVDTDAAEARGSSVILNVIDVLRCFTMEQPLLRVTEIADMVSLHKSSVSRILTTLQQERIVQRDVESRKYRLGLGLITVSGPLLADLDVRRVAFPVLQELTARTGETAALTVWEGTSAISVEQIPSPRTVKHTSPIGTRYATAASSTVQVFLAGQDADRVRELLLARAFGPLGPQDAVGGATAPTGAPSTEPVQAYLERLALVRERGYAINHGETSREEVGVAAPVLDHRGSLAAAVLVAAPSYRVGAEQLKALTEACRAAAAHITLRLGGRPRSSDPSWPIRSLREFRAVDPLLVDGDVGGDRLGGGVDRDGHRAQWS